MTLRRGWHLAAMLGALVVFLIADVAMGTVARAIRGWLAGRAAVTAAAADPDYAFDFRLDHPYYSHDLSPNIHVNALWGPVPYAMRTNSLGFRDAAPREVPARTPAVRWLFIGDSFLEGLGVDYPATVTGRLSARYGDGVDVLNAAVLSYAPAVYWKKTEYWLVQRGLQIDAVVVFLDISDIQDEAAAYRIDAAGHVTHVPPPSDLMAAWAGQSLTYRALTDATQWLWPHPALIGCRLPNAPEYPCRAGWTLSRVAMESFGQDGLERADTHMRQLAALLRARDIPLTVVVYPWPQHLLWNDRGSLQVRHWREWAAGERVAFVELFTPFFAEADTLGTRAAIEKYFIHGDIHWNDAGHRFVAEQFAHQAVPGPLPPRPAHLLR